MGEVRKSKSGIEYIETELRDGKTVVSRAWFWRIPHDSDREDIRLKIGRYRKPSNWFEREEPESENPRSELTLDNDEFSKLTEFIADNYEPLRSGARKFIPVTSDLDKADIENLRSLFSADVAQMASLAVEANILPEDLTIAMSHVRRCKALNEYRQMLADDLDERAWQAWFEKNDWILGTDFVELVDDRRVDVAHIADFLFRSYDGFLDVVEIKRPERGLHFWAQSRDHGNLVPSADLTKAITQALRYLHQIEKQTDSIEFRQRVGEVPVVKPRCTLVFGRSTDWGEDEREAYRLLNSAYHSLTVLTYDHVLLKAERALGVGPEAIGSGTSALE